MILGGCASINGEAEKGRSLKKVQRFFVLSNSNDNHALDQQIARALKAGGRSADVGPQTMMPDDTQAVVAYQDNWAWDFGEHLVYLNITVRDPLAGRAYASATFAARVPGKERVSDIVNQLVARLLNQGGTSARSVDRVPPEPDSAAGSRKRGR